MDVTTSMQTLCSALCRAPYLPRLCAVSPAAMLRCPRVFESYHAANAHARECDLRPGEVGEHAGEKRRRTQWQAAADAADADYGGGGDEDASDAGGSVDDIYGVAWLAEKPQPYEAAAAASDDGESELYDDDEQELSGGSVDTFADGEFDRFSASEEEEEEEEEKAALLLLLLRAQW